MIWIFTEVVMGLNPGYLLKSLLLYFSIFSCLEVIFWFFWFCKHLWWHRKYYVKSWVSEFKYMFKNSLTPLCHTSPHIMIPCRCLKSHEKKWVSWPREPQSRKIQLFFFIFASLYTNVWPVVEFQFEVLYNNMFFKWLHFLIRFIYWKFFETLDQ